MNRITGNRPRHSALWAITRKEFIQIRRDRATIYMVFIFPVMMLVLYGFGIRYDVKSVPMAIFDQDGTQSSRQYIERFARSPYFEIRRYARNYSELEEGINRGTTRIGIAIPPHFSAPLVSNHEVVVHVHVD